MKDQSRALDALRQEIDEIDTTLHDLFMRRAEISLKVAATKDDGEVQHAARPAREAAILRRLLARHHGSLPQDFIGRIWREIFSASLRLQADFSVYTAEAGLTGALSDLARFHFGFATPLVTLPSDDEVLRVLAEDRTGLGLLSLHAAAEPQDSAWWRLLSKQNASGLKVVASLPFFGASGDGPSRAGHPLSPAAFVVASAPFEASGDDHSLVVVEIASSVTPATAIEWLNQQGLPAIVVLSQARAVQGDSAILCDVAGFVTESDPRIAPAIAAPPESVKSVRFIGGYPAPFPLQAD